MTQDVAVLTNPCTDIGNIFQNVTMSSKEVANILKMGHTTVLRDIKSMLIEVVGGEKFVANRITGGLSIKAYIRQNYSTLFDELMVKIDETNWFHELLQGFSYDKDSRGYVTEFHMNSTLVHAFAARKDNIIAYRLVSRLNFLEREAYKQEFEAITNRVENQYRVKEIPFRKMEPSKQKSIIKGIEFTDLNRELVGIITEKMVIAIGKQFNDDNSSGKIENEPTKRRKYKKKKPSQESIVNKRTKNLIKSNKLDALKDTIDTWSISSAAVFLNVRPETLFRTLYRDGIIKNGTRPNCPNFTRCNAEVHNCPYRKYIDSNHFINITKYRKDFKDELVPYTQTRVTGKGLLFLIERYDNNIL